MLERQLKNRAGKANEKMAASQRPPAISKNQNNLYLNVNTANNNNSNNSLNVNSQFSPRKSVIGRPLERVSMQQQRLSDVGIAVGQQITAKIGLKLPASQERIVEQTRWLYLRYVLGKLHQNSLPLRDLNLTKSSRERRAAALGETILSGTSHQSAPNTAPIIHATSMDYGPQIPPPRRTVRSGTVNELDLSRAANKVLASTTTTTTTSLHYSHPTPTTMTRPQSKGYALASFESDYKSDTVANSVKKYIMDTTINSEILLVIVKIASQLRDIKSEHYGDTIYEHIGIDKFSSIQSLLDVQRTICQEMTRSEISWCRIVALFSLFGAMSLDCVRMGAPEHVGPLVDGFIEFVERDLALWISQQGGWESFLYKYRPGYHFRRLTSKLIIVALPLFIWILSLLMSW